MITFPPRSCNFFVFLYTLRSTKTVACICGKYLQLCKNSNRRIEIICIELNRFFFAFRLEEIVSNIQQTQKDSEEMNACTGGC